MPTFGIIGQAAFFVFAILWLREMPGRWRSDLENFRTATDPSDRIVVGVIWLVTCYFAFSILQFAFYAIG